MSVHVYAVNLDIAKDRWAFIERAFAPTRLTLCRVPAVNGRALQFPVADYSESGFRWMHGRGTNPAEVGCYLSHIKAMEMFLQTEEPHALICEDDVLIHPAFEEVLEAALKYSRHWNILRLTGLSTGNPVRVAPLCGDYGLCVNFGRLKGAGMYLIDRAAARAFVSRLVPMKLPFDHAVDREWFYGLRAACVLPFPCSQTGSGLRTSIQNGGAPKLSPLHRWLGTFPYQAFNETARFLFRAVNCIRWMLAPKRETPLYPAGNPPGVLAKL